MLNNAFWAPFWLEGPQRQKRLIHLPIHEARPSDKYTSNVQGSFVDSIIALGKFSFGMLEDSV